MKFLKPKNLCSLLLAALLLTTSTGAAFAAPAKEQKAIYGGTSFYDAGNTCSSGSAVLVGSENAEKIYNFLTSKGLTPAQAAGVMGNLQDESGFDPSIEEKDTGIGYGIAQWSYGRRSALEQAAKDKGVSVDDLAFQLDYLYNESNQRKSRDDSSLVEWTGLTQQTTTDDATDYWQWNFERPKKLHTEARRANAVNLLAQFGGGAASSTGSSSTTGCNTLGGPVDIIQKISFSETRTIKPTALVLHWWGGTGGIDFLISTLQTKKLSVQIGTTTDGKVYQLTPQLDSHADHAKCANAWAIGNEIEGGARFGPDPAGSGQTVALDLATNDVQFQAVVRITEQLMQKYNIPLDGDIAADGESGVGVHSHKEVDKFCANPSGKIDVDDIYLKKVKDQIRKDLESGTSSSPGTASIPACNSNVQLGYTGPGSTCDGLSGNYNEAQTQILQNLRDTSKEPPLSDIVALGNTRINKFILATVQSMIRDATAAGITLEPVVGFRSFDGQVYERRLFCGTTFDDIYVKSSSSCNPSVALPGQSNHQKGLAIDWGFSGETNETSFADTKEFTWLTDNAAKYGLKNLPSEPWHWSTDGN